MTVMNLRAVARAIRALAETLGTTVESVVDELAGVDAPAEPLPPPAPSAPKRAKVAVAPKVARAVEPSAKADKPARNTDPERDTKIRELAAAGQSAKAISVAVGISDAGVRLACKRLGVTLQTTRAPRETPQPPATHVRMRFPGGAVKRVPSEHVDEAKRRGAKVVDE